MSTTEPHYLSAMDVRDTLSAVGWSDEIIASFLGTTPEWLKQWRICGLWPGPAARILNEMAHDPEYWSQRIRECATVTTGEF